MKSVLDLSLEALRDIVLLVQNQLYWDEYQDMPGSGEWLEGMVPDKECSGADLCEALVAKLVLHDLVPARPGDEPERAGARSILGDDFFKQGEH